MCKCRQCEICLPLRGSNEAPPHRSTSLPPPPLPQKKKREAGRGAEAAVGHAAPDSSAAVEASRGAVVRASAAEPFGARSAPPPGSHKGDRPEEKTPQEVLPHQGRWEKPAGGGMGGGAEATGSKGGGAAWKPGQCAEWCKAGAADECALGGCVACPHCQSKPGKPTGQSVHDKLLTHPLLLPFPLPKHPPSSALGALIASVAGLSFSVLLALVWLRRHARPQYSALLERLPQRWAQRADFVASLGRSLGGVGYRAAHKGEGFADDDTDAQRSAALGGGAYSAPAPDGGQHGGAEEDPFDAHARVAAVSG